MVIEGCECNFGIPGVDKLPAHDHSAARLAADMLRLNPDSEQLDALIAEHYAARDEVHIWVDWKAVARPNPNATPAPAAP